jgi:hypothetical protein
MGDVFAILVGGLGGDQTGTIRKALEQIPGVRVVSAGIATATSETCCRWWRFTPLEKIVMILHSFALRAGLELCEQLADRNIRVNYVGILDGVMDDPCGRNRSIFPPAPTRPWRVISGGPRSPSRCFQRYHRRSLCHHPGPSRVLFVDGTDHNTLCHQWLARSATGVVGRITERVRGE